MNAYSPNTQRAIRVAPEAISWIDNGLMLPRTDGHLFRLWGQARAWLRQWSQMRQIRALRDYDQVRLQDLGISRADLNNALNLRCDKAASTYLTHARMRNDALVARMRNDALVARKRQIASDSAR